MEWIELLGIPISVWIYSQISQGWRRWKRQDFLYNNILAEIERTQKGNRAFQIELSAALDSGLLDKRVLKPDYFIFVDIGNTAPSVFRAENEEFRRWDEMQAGRSSISLKSSRS